MLAASLAPAGAALGVGSTTLAGPDHVAPGASALLQGTYAGPVRGGLAVDVLVNGEKVGRATTASDGSFSFLAPFPTKPGEHHARAVVRPVLGVTTPADSGSPTLVVRVKSPAAPADLAATAVQGQPVVRLSWTAQEQDPLAPRQGYRVESRPAFGNWSLASTLGPDATGVDLPATMRSSPSYRVAAIGVGDHLGEFVQATASPPPPGAPTDLAATLTDANVQLSWTPPTFGGPVQGYRVLRGLELRALLPASATSWSDPTVAAGSYRFSVVAENVGSVGASDSVDVTIRGPSALAALSATGTDAPGVLLSWTHGDLGDAATATTRIERFVNAFPHPRWETVALATGTSHEVTGLEPGTTHSFRLTPSTPRGTAPSSQADATTLWPAVWFPLKVEHRYCARAAGSTSPYACSTVAGEAALTVGSGREFTIQPIYSGRVVLDGAPAVVSVTGDVATARDGGAPTSLAWSNATDANGRFSGSGPVLGPFVTVGDGWSSTFASTLTAASGGHARTGEASITVNTPPPPPEE